MINFRYHVISLAAVLMALAAGVVLGAGFLDRSDDISSAEGPSDDAGVTAFDAGYATRTAPGLIEGSLDGQSIVLFTTSGARAADVRGARAALESAGAQIAGEVELTSDLLEPGGRQFADGVIERAGAEVPEVSGAEAGYDRIGAALSRAYLTQDATEVDDAANTLRSALEEGELVANTSALESRGTLAVVVTGPRSSATESHGATLAALATAMDQGSNGVVVAGPTSSSLDGGIIADIRADEGAAQVATVDVVDLAAGRIVVAMAARQVVDDQAGAWGTSRSADGSLPE